MLSTIDTNGLSFAKKVNDPAVQLIEQLLGVIGENPAREGLSRTPERFKKAFLEMTSGYGTTAEAVVGEGIFKSESNGPVFVQEIEFFSLCEHHLLPFTGKVSIGYFPREKILGLSKLARIVDVFAKRLQVQERLTREIAESIFTLVDARAVIVTVEATHMCMSMRGVKKINATTQTQFTLGFDQLTVDEKETARKTLR